jgi:hypothetical protein
MEKQTKDTVTFNAVAPQNAPHYPVLSCYVMKLTPLALGGEQSVNGQRLHTK